MVYQSVMPVKEFIKTVVAQEQEDNGGGGETTTEASDDGGGDHYSNPKKKVETFHQPYPHLKWPALCDELVHL
ncbi:hypothetical protein TYRP_014207 [Tyrophagus putrescentiae]|nr:hypothetical protein TYRP_014207 [Tyrophagus putrescentiae]